ncbi:hypothetical protein D3C87_1019040 [compost metagenome]
MKSFLVTIGILLTGMSAFSAEIVVQSEPVPTCFQRSNTAIGEAIRNAEKKALEKCADPILIDLQTQIDHGACGFVQVFATYDCLLGE